MLLLKVLPMVFLCLVGYGLKQAGVFKPEDTRTIGKLLSTLAIPAIVIKAIATIPLTPDLICLPLSALFVVSCLIAIGFLCNHFLKWDRETAGAWVITLATFEGGAVGIPLMLLAFGDFGLSRFVLFDLTQGIILFTVIYSLSIWFGKAEDNLKPILQKLLRTPLLWSILIGFLLNILNIRSAILVDSLNLAGNGFLLLILVLLGLELQVKLFALPLHLAMTFFKTACGLLLGLITASFFGLEGVERAVVIVGAAQPPSLLTILFSKENNLNTGLVVNFVSVAIPFSLVFLTVLMNFL